MSPAAVARTKTVLSRFVERWRREGRSIGLVPTMGALHEGHAELIGRAAAECDRVIVSVFVNPLQFAPGEDYARYPRRLKDDRRLSSQAGADLVYAPSVEDLYPPGFQTQVEVTGLSKLHCGRYRPGHFRGVATVVLKLLHRARPDRAYFGEKDFQQLVIVETMVADLDVPVTIVPVPTIREKDGLALSSRNVYLSPAERAAAPALRAALEAGLRRASQNGATPASVVLAVRRALAGTPLRLQYAAVADAATLAPARSLQGRRRLLAAAFLGKTRLIDNIPLEKRR